MRQKRGRKDHSKNVKLKQRLIIRKGGSNMHICYKNIPGKRKGQRTKGRIQ